MAAAMPMPTSQRPVAPAGGPLRPLVPAERARAVAACSRRAGGRRRAGRSRGEPSGSLRMRSSIGSRPSVSASSSIATSKAIMPIASPGARMSLAHGRSSSGQRVRGEPVRRGVEGAALVDHLLGELVERGRVRRAPAWAKRRQPAVAARAEPHALDRGRAVGGVDVEHLLARSARSSPDAEHARRRAPPAPRRPRWRACRRSRRRCSGRSGARCPAGICSVSATRPAAVHVIWTEV